MSSESKPAVELEKVSLLVEDRESTSTMGTSSATKHAAAPAAASSSSSAAASGSMAATVGWIVASIGTSVGIILVNKFVMTQFGFKWVLSLTALHFLVATIGMELMACMGFFKRQYMPFRDSFIVGGTAIGSISCMNFSLQLNSVGFYQVLKLLCIPCMVMLQSTFYGVKFSMKIKSILFVILVGVGIATVTDVSLNFVGCLFGAGAVLFTAQFQIWQGEKQRQYSLSPMQINHALALPSFLWCASLALMFEFRGENSILLHELQESEGAWIFLSCMLSIAVNISSYGLIGATSPVTFQVVGHAKTCGVLIGGFLMYPVNDQSALLKNIAGIVIAMLGVIVYGNIKMLESKSPKQPDWCDLFLPSAILNFLVDHK